jgi:hypothetical protein
MISTYRRIVGRGKQEMFTFGIEEIAECASRPVAHNR